MGFLAGWMGDNGSAHTRDCYGGGNGNEEKRGEKEGKRRKRKKHQEIRKTTREKKKKSKKAARAPRREGGVAVLQPNVTPSSCWGAMVRFQAPPPPSS